MNIHASRDCNSAQRHRTPLHGRYHSTQAVSRFIARPVTGRLTDKILYPYADIVQVYATQTADSVEWNMIGPDQWVEARIFATVTPNVVAPEGVTTGRWIDVNLAEQTLAVYDNSQLVFATVIATGLEPFWTRPGLFQIYQKKETETMRNNDPTDYYYLDNVPWTMYFDKARVHGAFGGGALDIRSHMDV